MAYFSGIEHCPKCDKEISWHCEIKEGNRGTSSHGAIENHDTYEPTILSTPKAKIHVLCFVCEECGEIFIVKKSRSTRNFYKFG